MTLPDTYSRRMRAAAGATADVYSYESASKRLRIQIAQLVQEGFGPYENQYGRPAPGADAYDALVRLLRKELGVHKLSNNYNSNAHDEFIEWIQSETSIDYFLDGIEFFLRMISSYVRENWSVFGSYATQKPDEVIAEFNARAREAGFGYQFSNEMIVRIDSQFLHQEAVLPALKLLNDGRFDAANREYRDAHEAYKLGKLKDSLVGCARAFESVLKIIGTKRGWPIQQTDNANQLIMAAAKAGFLPAYQQNALNHLQGLLTSGVPTVRNKTGGHGDGSVIQEVPVELAAFQLHQTAAVIVFLAERDKALG